MGFYSKHCLSPFNISRILLFFQIFWVLCKFGEALNISEISKYGILNSFSNLTHWARNDRELYRLAKSKIEILCSFPTSHDEATMLANVHSYIDDFESSNIRHVKGMMATETDVPFSNSELDDIVASNLILVFRMTNRFSKFGQSLKDFLSLRQDKRGFPVCANISSFINTEQWPGKVEHDICTYTFLTTYKIHDIVTHPANFILDLSLETETPALLSAEMTFEIAQVAFEWINYVQGFDWINYSMHLVDLGDLTISRMLLWETKLQMIEKHNIDLDKYPEYDDRFYNHVILHQDANTEAERNWEKRRLAQFEYFSGDTEAEITEINMWGICSQRRLTKQSQNVTKLKCFMDTTSHPYLAINPLRTEILAETPQILQFHDIIGELLIDRIVKAMEETERLPSVVGDVNKTLDTLRARSSINSWFTDQEKPKLARISEIVTGLQSFAPEEEPMGSEPFQAVEYVVGRHYTIHNDVGDMDQHPNITAKGGVRVATLLYYLNDVRLGGFTAFANAGVAARPIKGSAVFWMNTYRNGNKREDYWHASCPVLSGRKLVINKWFLENLQFRKRPCTLNQNE